MALPVFVLDRYGLGVELGITLALRLIPAVVAGGAAAWAMDRFDARFIAVVSTVVTGATIAMIPFTQSMVELNVLSVIGGFTGLFATPALMKMRSIVISPENAVRANGLIVSAERLPLIIGPAVSAGVLVLWNVDLLLFAEAATTVLAGVIILTLPKSEIERDPEQEPVSLLAVLNVKVLWRMAGSERRTQGYLVTGLFYTAAMAAGRVFLVVFAASYGMNESALAWFLASMAFGAVVGGLIGSGFSAKILGPIYLVGCLAEGAIWISLGLAPPFWLVCVLLVAAGLLESVATTAFFADIQLRMKPGAIGRFFAIFVPMTAATGVLGSLIGGLAASDGIIWIGATMVGLLISVPLIPYAKTYWTRETQEKGNGVRSPRLAVSEEHTS